MVRVLDSSTGGQVTCLPDPGILSPYGWSNEVGNILEFDCNTASGDQIEVTEVSRNSLALQSVSIFGESTPVTATDTCNTF